MDSHLTVLFKERLDTKEPKKQSELLQAKRGIPESVG